MDGETFALLLQFAVPALFSPGPNNLMLLASGVNFGLLRTLPHIAGILTGVMLLMLLSGFGVGALLTTYPDAKLALKIVGGVFLLYLAWKIATARTKGAGESERTHPLRYIQAAAFQLVNPKAWVLAVTTMITFCGEERATESVLATAGVFVTLSSLSSATWAIGGTTLRGFLADPVRLKWFNIAMGVLLAATLWPLLR